MHKISDFRKKIILGNNWIKGRKKLIDFDTDHVFLCFAVNY